MIRGLLAVWSALLLTGLIRADDPAAVKETVVAGPLDVTLKVRMEGPYTADVPLQAPTARSVAKAILARERIKTGPETALS